MLSDSHLVASVLQSRARTCRRVLMWFVVRWFSGSPKHGSLILRARGTRMSDLWAQGLRKASVKVITISPIACSPPQDPTKLLHADACLPQHSITTTVRTGVSVCVCDCVYMCMWVGREGIHASFGRDDDMHSQWELSLS